ncbi:MAG: sensor histidine kinase [Treponema sp.]|jgi:two-component system sensor histidine kinase YesM|nr:sensor histidine kinase [Treponema sp.]
MGLFKRLKQGAGSIATRHLRFFLLFISLPVLVMLALFGFLFRRQFVAMTTEQRKLTLQRHAASIDVDLRGMSIIASSLIHNAALMERSRAFVRAATSDQRYLVSSDMEKIFNTYSLLSRQLVGFHVIFNGESVPFVSRNYAGISLSAAGIASCVAAAEESPGLIAFPGSLNFSHGQPAEVSAGWYIVSLAVAPPRNTYNTGVRTLVVSFVINPLMDFIRQRNSPMNAGRDISSSFLTGRDGVVLASSDTGLVGSDISEVERVYKKSYVVISAPVESSGWTLVEAINIRSLTQPINTILYILYIAVTVIALFFIRYNAFFFASIFTPLKTLSAKMETVANGDFSARAPASNYTELNKISESFNYMVEEISKLTGAIKEEQKERVRTEIEALRYQLNPHFLCNALNAIRMMAIITKNDAIRKMSAALMMITEDTLAREDTVYSLEHELDILDNYVYIMKVRYGDTFELIRDVDNSLLNLGVPSMILQPLVENAILHGFHGLSRPGTIVVSAALPAGATPDGETPGLIISVRDNGNGMSGETLAGIFEGGRRDHHGLSKIGLYNVRRRIMLAYGSAYTVEAASYPGEGTVVTLLLPVQETARYESRAAPPGREGEALC